MGAISRSITTNGRRIKSWLTKGHPLSLIALDAMVSCILANEDVLYEMAQNFISRSVRNKVNLNSLQTKRQCFNCQRSVETILENKTEIFQYMNPLQISIKKKPQNF